jgi:hypothetical protein
MPLGLKDIRSVLAAAEAQRVPMPVASLVRDISSPASPAAARGSTGRRWRAWQPRKLDFETGGGVP